SVAAVLNYHGPLEALETHIRYDGILDRSSQGQRSIPYTVAADADYTSATLVAHKIAIASGLTALRLQGRINQLLSRNISGKLEYSGNVQVPFLSYFFPAETFGGKADVAGFIEFSSDHLSTQGRTSAVAVDFNGWHPGQTEGEYAYGYP